jgi:hypothetical protein
LRTGGFASLRLPFAFLRVSERCYTNHDRGLEQVPSAN